MYKNCAIFGLFCIVIYVKFFFAMLHANNYSNRPVLHGAIQKLKVVWIFSYDVYYTAGIVHCFAKLCVGL